MRDDVTQLLARIEILEARIELLNKAGGPPPPFDRVRLSVLDGLAFSTPSPVPFPFALLTPGDAIRDVAIVIQTAFDGPTATISIGTIANPNLIFPAAQNLPGKPGDYRVDSTYIAPAAQPIFVFITPGTSTMGLFRVFFSFEKF
jgi:hypothetical protein